MKKTPVPLWFTKGRVVVHYLAASIKQIHARENKDIQEIAGHHLLEGMWTSE